MFKLTFALSHSFMLPFGEKHHFPAFPFLETSEPVRLCQVKRGCRLFVHPIFGLFLPFDVLLTTIIRSDWGNLSLAFILFQLQSLVSSRLCSFLS